MACVEAQRLIEQRIAMGARDCRAGTRERERNFLVRIVAVPRRNKIFALNREERGSDSVGVEQSVRDELPDLLLSL
jgi:hypothetical protein